MVTLAFAQMVYYFFHDTKIGGGSDGIYINARPESAVPGLDLANDLHFYYFVARAPRRRLSFCLQIILRSPFGRALQGIKVNEHRMRALGFPTLRYKLAAFVLAGTIAGLAGYLAAAKEGYVNPEMMAWHQSGTVLMMLILGGVGTLFGAVLGDIFLRAAAGMVLGADQALAAADGHFIVVAVLVLPRGAGRTAAGCVRRLRAGRARERDDD